MSARSRRRLWGALGALAGVAGAALWAYVVMLRMPGATFEGALPPLSRHEEETRDAVHRDIAGTGVVKSDLDGGNAEQSVPDSHGLRERQGRRQAPLECHAIAMQQRKNVPSQQAFAKR